MSNTSFHFPPHHAQISCLIIRLTTNTITATITVQGERWRLLIYVLHNFLLCNNVVFSETTTTVLESFTNSTGRNMCWSLFSLGMMKLNKDICSVWIKVDLHSVNMSRANNEIRWQIFIFFFNLNLRQMKCSAYLTNLLFLLTRRSSH